MKVYKYDIQTKEFIQEFEINEAYGINLPFTTTAKPLAKKEGFAVCFNDTKWEYVEDNRDKTVYTKATKEELKVDYLGKIKDEHTLLVPKEFDEWDYIKNQWIENIEKKETQRIQQIEAKCNQVIEAVYPIYKQINITNLLTPYIEEDRDVMKSFIDSKRAICHKDIADESPLEPGVFLIPANSTTVKPLERKDGFYIKFNSGLNEFVYEEKPIEVKEADNELSEEELASQLQEQVNAEARAMLNRFDWKVIRELERLMLAGTDLNLEREALRVSVV